MNKKLIKVQLDLVDNRYGELMPIGDIHIGNKGHDANMYKKYLETLYKEKHFKVLGMGDWIECATTRANFRLYDQVMSIDDQIDQIVEDFAPIADEGRLIGILEGNHERTATKEGFDPTHRIAKELGVKNLKVGTLLDIRAGKEKYIMYASHGSSGARTPSGKMNACMRMRDIVEADIYCHAHVHALDHRTSDIYVPARVYIQMKRKHYVITGAFLQYLGTYAEQKLYQPSGISGAPKIKFHSDMHRISVTL